MEASGESEANGRLAYVAGDPPRQFFKRTSKFTCGPGTRVDYLALYDVDLTKPERRAAFLRKVEARFSAW